METWIWRKIVTTIIFNWILKEMEMYICGCIHNTRICVDNKAAFWVVFATVALYSKFCHWLLRNSCLSTSRGLNWRPPLNSSVPYCRAVRGVSERPQSGLRDAEKLQTLGTLVRCIISHRRIPPFVSCARNSIFQKTYRQKIKWNWKAPTGTKFLFIICENILLLIAI